MAKVLLANNSQSLTNTITPDVEAGVGNLGRVEPDRNHVRVFHAGHLEETVRRLQ